MLSGRGGGSGGPGLVALSAAGSVPGGQLAVSAGGRSVVDPPPAAAGSWSATWRTAATSARKRSTRTRQAPQASTCRRTESGTAPPPTRSSSSWSLGQGIESISQVLQVVGAELPDPGQDARTVDVDGAGGQA